jgi:hypothetical protein
MNTNTIFRGTFIAFCLIGMLALPAAAAPDGQGMKNNTIDQGLKDDLWANHQQFRLQGFDMNVERSESVITILGNYGVDTSTCQSTLSTISGKRSDLETALSAQDREGLKGVNAELKTLWQQFRTDMKETMKGHYGKGITSGAASSARGSATV